MNDSESRADNRLEIPLLMLVGIPGSGKSTWAANFVAAHPRHGIVSTDNLRAALYGDEVIQGDWQQIWQRVLTQWRGGIEAIRQRELDGVIYDATNTRRRNRRGAIAAARDLGFTSITLVWFDLPLSLALERNRGRSRQVPADVIAAMHRQLQGAPPSVQEGCDRLLVLGQSRYPGTPF